MAVGRVNIGGGATGLDLGINHTVASLNHTKIVSNARDVTAFVSNDNYVYSDNGSNVFKYDKKDMTQLLTGPAYGGTANTMILDGEFLYVLGNLNKIKIYNNSNLTVVSEHNIDVGRNTPVRMVIDDDFIYVVGINCVIVKINKSDMSMVAITETTSLIITDMVQDTDYLYVVGRDSVIRKYDKSDLSLVDEADDYGTNIYTASIDGGYLYISGWSKIGLAKYDVSDLSLVAGSGQLEGNFRNMYGITVIDDYVYSNYGDYVYKFDKSVMGLLGASMRHPATLNLLTSHEQLIYATGRTDVIYQLVGLGGD